ncbi:heparanase-like protein 1 [Lycium barbarum]|uniref:heparanase-like protein 1 n=1 Tax=Lycium barbarum TaxID=112863 RepID=UPI00293E880D|nr:heparanase-like protein 1 [Lycium barbarum]XP_060205003.1 heparanase-like protein 1 [Lycium barbarum]
MDFRNLLIFLALCPAFSAQTIKDTELMIDASVKIAQTDANYICATIDWWPKEKCNYKQCPWGLASIIHLDLSHPFLENAIRAFKGLRLRLGGSLQDQVIYGVGNLKSPCHPFTKQKDGLFGFSKGCLHMHRWDELNGLFKKTGALVTFGLNALYGRRRTNRHVWVGNWDASNALDFIRYTVAKGYQIHSWELGNELSGNGIGASVNAVQYGKDVIHLHNLINQVYKNFHGRPLLLAPGGFYGAEWFSKLLKVSGPGTVNALTHHIYNLGPGSDHKLVDKILNPEYLNKISDTYRSLTQTIERNGPWASAWVGESGGAYNSGGPNVSNAFVDSFWYLDQLGMAAKHHTKVYCRQTLIGGNYGLLDTKTFVPNPDYYSALLWNKLMGKEVLDVSSKGSPHLRSYAHCTKDRAGVTLLLINLSNQIHYGVNIQSSAGEKKNPTKKSFVHGLKESVSWLGSRSSDVTLLREEYHLTPEGGSIKSRRMLLNGKLLQLTERGDIPSLSPVLKSLKSPISIAPLSIKFIVFPNFNSPSCS